MFTSPLFAYFVAGCIDFLQSSLATAPTARAPAPLPVRPEEPRSPSPEGRRGVSKDNQASRPAPQTLTPLPAPASPARSPPQPPGPTASGDTPPDATSPSYRRSAGSPDAPTGRTGASRGCC